jgi:thiamine-phosphate pyrophosphorylase
VRAKGLASGSLLEICTDIVRRANAAGALVIVNDRADIARLAGAGGVHVGQEDLSPLAVRAIVGQRMAIGLSTHTRAQLEAASIEPVEYLAIGPVFETATKATGYRAVGTERVREAAAIARSVGRPLVAIGGITLERAPDVIGAGAQSVAVIGDLFVGGRPDLRVKAFLERLHV